MPTKLSITRDINGLNAYGLKPSDINVNVALDASSDTAFTVPNTDATGGLNYQNKSQWLAIFSFSSGSDVWVSINSTASAPAGNTFALTSSFSVPAALELQGGDVIHCFTTQSNVTTSIRFYSLS